ncbi:serine/threonine-protein kinase [Streptomyces sp. NBC_00872]|uniref:serine/threonine-protein kinase n=1 Tax=Streptomyces sp. NBC_00872 TaxID=2903686 RepID=UPI0038666651|nr:serine/threonine protein kinase [Streptomyces sp. NBC_00872]
MQSLTAEDPRRVGAYRLLYRLGEGGMGRVYLGRSPGGQTVAVKMVHAGMASAPGFRERFAREVRVSREVSGPGTVPVLAAAADAPIPWLASAYVPGPSLAEAVHDHGPLPEPSLWRLLAGLARALSTVHGCALVHRDLKPTNVLLSSDGPLLIDFGIARAADDTAFTATGSVVGSAGYMSPEQAHGEQVGPASDIFSLGAVLTFAALGSGPFGNGSPPELLYRAVHDEPNLNGMPEDYAAVVGDCLAKGPADRPSPEDLLARAEEHRTDEPWLPGPLVLAIARKAEQLLSVEAEDDATRAGTGGGPPPSTAVITEADSGSRPWTPPSSAQPSSIPPPSGRSAYLSGSATPRSYAPPAYQPPAQPRPAGPRAVPAHPGPRQQVWVNPWVRRGPLSHPLLSLFGLAPATVLLVTGSSLKAIAHDHTSSSLELGGWKDLTEWAMTDDGWRLPLTLLLIVMLIVLQYFRARLEQYPVAVTRSWNVAIGCFWLLLTGTVIANFLWLMGRAAGAEEDAGDGRLLLLRGLVSAVLMLDGLVTVPVAVAAFIRVLRGVFGDVARPVHP